MTTHPTLAELKAEFFRLDNKAWTIKTTIERPEEMTAELNVIEEKKSKLSELIRNYNTK